MKRTIENLTVANKRVFLRADLNVPLDENCNIVDASRIEAELPTIRYLLSRKAKVILCSHLGRPKGKVVNSMSLLPVAKYLINTLHCKVHFSSEAVGEVAENKVKELKSGELLLLENIRFYAEEEDNNLSFAKKLASLADIYVNDAFGTAHRKHASTYALATLLDNATGFLMGKEINAISGALDHPKKPFIAILGGAKVSDKLNIVKNMIDKCSDILIGGAMSYTFLKAQGASIGKSLFEKDMLDNAKEILNLAKQKNVNIHLPVDHICGEMFSPNAKSVKIKSVNIPDDLMGLDIGKKTIKDFVSVIKSAKTIVWNGPMGVFEFENFKSGTKSVAKAVAKSKAKSIVGGGDSISAINKLKLANKIYHISTGGGASLKLISGEVLPGVEVLTDI